MNTNELLILAKSWQAQDDDNRSVFLLLLNHTEIGDEQHVVQTTGVVAGNTGDIKKVLKNILQNGGVQDREMAGAQKILLETMLESIMELIQKNMED